MLRVLLITVPPLRRVTFSRRRKSNQKGFPLTYGTSLRLSVPSLRCPSGGIASGLLRCTSSRCMRLRRTALRASPLMNTFARPADGVGDLKQHQKPEPDQSQSKIKRLQLSGAASDWGHSVRDWSVVRPPSRAGSLLQGSWAVCRVGWLAGRHRWQASSHGSRHSEGLVGCQAAIGWQASSHRKAKQEQRTPCTASAPHHSTG